MIFWHPHGWILGW